MISITLEDRPLALDKESLDKLTNNINADLKELALLMNYTLEAVSNEGVIEKLRNIFTKACDLVIGLIKKIGSFIFKQFKIILGNIKGDIPLDRDKLLSFRGQFKVYDTKVSFSQISDNLDRIYQKLFDYTKNVEQIIVGIITNITMTDPDELYENLIENLKRELNVNNVSDIVSEIIFGCTYSEIVTKYRRVSLIEYLQVTCEYRDTTFPDNPSTTKLFGAVETYDAVGKWSSQFAKANTRLKKYYDTFRYNQNDEIKRRGLEFMDTHVLSWLNGVLLANTKDLNRLPEYLLNHAKYYEIVTKECKL